MYLKEITIDNFRNLKRQKVSFSSGLNVIYGDNAQGKSNIIECIRLLSIGKSFKNSKNFDMLNFKNNYFYIKGKFILNDEDKTIEIIYKKNQNRIVKINSNKIKSMSELVGNVLTTIFSPEDLNIIKSNPSIRRKYIDAFISMIKKSYLYYLLQYNKLLRNRNKVIKDIKFDNEKADLLDIFDEELSHYGSKIIVYRIQYLRELDIAVKKIAKEISGENVKLRYISNIIDNSKDISEIQNKFYNKLKNNHENDIKYGDTKYGTQRDDIKIMIDDYDSRIYASQGQQRTLALCLKLAEQDIIEKETKNKPILLLDDVMSELDINRRKYILKNIVGTQSFITHTNRNNINGDKFFHVIDGVIYAE